MDEDYEAFKAMAEEELRIKVRGNFVQVDFVPLIHRKTEVRREDERAGGGNGGKPNFKKFRSKGNSSNEGVRRRGVAMVLPESNDYGLGQSYWDQDQGTESARSVCGGRRASRLAVSDEETQPVRRFTAKSRTRVALDQDNPINLNVDLDSEDEGDMTTLLRRQNNRGRKRPAPAVEESDEDISTPATGRGIRKIAATAMVLDDEDSDSDGGDGVGGDDGNFAGFGKTTSTRRRRVDTTSGRNRRSVF